MLPLEFKDDETPLSAETFNYMQTRLLQMIKESIDKATSGEVLFEDIGISGSFTLNGDSYIYDRIKIFGFLLSSGIKRQFSQEIKINPDDIVSNAVTISVVANLSASKTIVGTAKLNFNREQVVLTGNITRIIPGSETANNEIYITKVVGFKECELI